MPRICARSRRSAGWRLASSTTVGSRRIAPTGRSSAAAVCSRQRRDRLRDRTLTRIEPAHPRQPAPDLVGVALVGRLGDRDALLARPLEPAALGQAALDVVGQRQQMLDVAARIADLLIGQRSRVPAREAGRLRQPDPEHVVEQAVVAGLCREAREARRDLRVEDVRERRLPLAPQDRYVLAAGVQNDLDRRDRPVPRPAASGRSGPPAGRAPPRARRPRSARDTATAGSGPRA